MNRKVISLTTRHLSSGDDQLIALCNDGTMWLARGSFDLGWREIKNIPPAELPETGYLTGKKVG